MNWLSLIPAALGLMGGIFSGGQKTETTTPQMSPQLKALADQALGKAKAIWAQPYQKYTGERVAGPTASRTALNPLMNQMGFLAKQGLGDNAAGEQRLSTMMARGPARVTAPPMVNGGVQAPLTGM